MAVSTRRICLHKVWQKEGLEAIVIPHSDISSYNFYLYLRNLQGHFRQFAEPNQVKGKRVMFGDCGYEDDLRGHVH